MLQFYLYKKPSCGPNDSMAFMGQRAAWGFCLLPHCHRSLHLGQLIKVKIV